MAYDETVTTREDEPLPITLGGSDPDGDVLDFRLVDYPEHGKLSGAVPDKLIYTPNVDYHGSDRFTFRVSDGKEHSPAAAVSIAVSPVNDAPVAVPLNIATVRGHAREIHLSGSDSEGDQLTYVIASGPEHGSLTGEGASRVYTPDEGYSGKDSFAYKVRDGKTDSGAASVSIEVRSENHAPVAEGGTFRVASGESAEVSLRATDEDGDSVTFELLQAPAHGVLGGELSSGRLVYTPQSGFQGEDEFSFKATDGIGDSAPATIKIVVGS